MYITRAQLIVLFGEAELIQLTDREPFTDAINDEVLTIALDSAHKKIDGYLRSVYSLPLSDDLIAGSNLQEVAADMVRYSLYKAKEKDSECVRTAYKDAINWLKDVQAKRVTLGKEDISVAETGAVLVKQGVSCINWGSY